MNGNNIHNIAPALKLVLLVLRRYNSLEIRVHRLYVHTSGTIPRVNGDSRSTNMKFILLFPSYLLAIVLTSLPTPYQNTIPYIPSVIVESRISMRRLLLVFKFCIEPSLSLLSFSFVNLDELHNRPEAFRHARKHNFTVITKKVKWLT